MMLIEVTVRWVDNPRDESRTTRTYAVPPTDDWKVPMELWKFLGTVASPLLERSLVEVFETGHEPWDRVYDVAMPNLAVRWCAEHTRYEVAT